MAKVASAKSKTTEVSNDIQGALSALEEAVSRLEGKVEHTVNLANQDQAELFGISAEEKQLNKTIATKLDSTIARLETLLTEEG